MYTLCICIKNIYMYIYIYVYTQLCIIHMYTLYTYIPHSTSGENKYCAHTCPSAILEWSRGLHRN